MLKKAKKCSIPYCNAFCWSKNLCRWHYIQAFPTPLKKQSKGLKRSKLSKTLTPRAIEKKVAKKTYTELQFKGFLEFYNNHQTKRCEQCNVKIPECLSVNVHHLLPKSQELYKKVALDSRFWLLLCGNCHSTFENSGKGDKIIEKTKEAKELFNIENQ